MEGENPQTKFIQWPQVVRDVPLPAGKLSRSLHVR